MPVGKIKDAVQEPGGGEDMRRCPKCREKNRFAVDQTTPIIRKVLEEAAKATGHAVEDCMAVLCPDCQTPAIVVVGKAGVERRPMEEDRLLIDGDRDVEETVNNLVSQLRVCRRCGQDAVRPVSPESDVGQSIIAQVQAAGHSTKRLFIGRCNACGATASMSLFPKKTGADSADPAVLRKKKKDKKAAERKARKKNRGK